MFVSQIFDECAEILGTTDENKVFRKIQQAVQTLLESGHWTHATAEVDVCTGWDRCSLALPLGVDVPLAVNIDGSPTYFRNRLFQYHVNKGGMFNSVEWAWDDRGYVATLMDIIQPSQLVAVAESNNDVGKKIRVLGLDQNNRNLRSQMPNGAGVDGILIPIHSQQDFQYGTIAPDDATIATRNVSITPIKNFTTTTPHGLSSGQGMSARLISGTIPIPLSDGQTYYIGVIDAYTVQLFSDSLNAQVLQYPISLQSIVGFGSMQLQDRRNASVVTSMEFASAPSFAINSPNEVVFPNTPLPAPLEADKTYFAQQIDSTHLNIFESLSDANSNSNPIYTTGSTSPIDIDIRKPIVPEVKFVFSVKHYFNDGDQVQAITSGGTLPSPLIANQNYFVNVIDDFSVSLHENKSDAVSSTPTNLVNPIKITTSGSGTNSLVKLIQATSITGKVNQITAPELSISVPSGSGASFNAVVVGSVTDINITAAGSGYTTTPDITFSAPPVPPVTSPLFGQQKTATGYAVRSAITNSITGIVITDPGFGYIKSSPPTITIDPPPVNPTISVSLLTASGTTATCTTSSAHNFSNGSEVVISGASPSGYNGTYVVTVVSPTVFTYNLNASVGYDLTLDTITVSASIATATTVATTSHGFSDGQVVYISGASPTEYNGKKTIDTTGVGVNQFKYNVSGVSIPAINAGSVFSRPATGSITCKLKDGSQTVAVCQVTTSVLSHFTQNSGGSGYTEEPQVKIEGGNGNGAVATANISGGVVTSLNVVATGSGYTSIPSVSISPSTGVLINFTSTGSLPSPILSGTSYRAESPNSVTKTFTVKNVDFSDVNITSAPTGTLYVVLSRSFNLDWTNNWLGDFTSLTSGQQIYFGTDYILPTTSPSIDNGVTPAYLKITSNSIAKAYQNSSLTTLINVNSFGVGQTYYAIRAQVSPSVDSNLIKPTNTAYLSEDEVVQFSTSGTLPTPLTASTDYTIKIIGDSVRVYSGSSPVVLTSTGIGQLSLDIIRSVNVQPSTSIVAPSSLYETGTQLVARANTGDVLPNGLIANTNYYVRRIDSNSFELYDTLAHAKNLTSTTGRKSYTTSGNSASSTFFVDAIYEPIFVKSVAHVEKPITDGYVSLYAWDYGRSNDMTLIGQYHPTEVNPSYRRIRIGKPCAWARIIYKVTSPSISSMYDFIPLEQERAIIAAVHAVDLEDKDFADQSARYWQIAFAYLKNQQESIDGHAMSVPQINAITYGDTTDPVMW